ncbi:helix-turn-helix domain-containing protein [Leisingera daeponensis]|uniref:Helix-turn-helix domain-containing protein n=1 Tax=Leisingera daeponensis TaxID=405746 RepID=A0ABS7NBC4_9RHOB|nr:helix-turn-helix domain-containing protein [Leisingera daeponensis]MBY6138509.1 helix-turn-helix domain-containing protein [Leisingera daeponensis]
MTDNTLPLLLRDTQVAHLLGIGRTTVWNRANSGKLPKPIKWEGVTVWRRTEIEKFVEELAG